MLQNVIYFNCNLDKFHNSPAARLLPEADISCEREGMRGSRVLKSIVDTIFLHQGKSPLKMQVTIAVKRVKIYMENELIKTF